MSYDQVPLDVSLTGAASEGAGAGRRRRGRGRGDAVLRPDAVEVTWRGPAGLGDRILYREDEPRIGEVSPGRRWVFEGDGDAFRLASEALRIRLAHLFDPYAAVNASHIEPLPHRLTAVYDAILEPRWIVQPSTIQKTRLVDR